MLNKSSRKLLLGSATLAFLVACGATLVEPSVELNFAYQLLHPVEHSWPATLLEEEDAALDDLPREESLLYSSNEPHIVEWRNRIEHLRDRPALEQAVGINRIVNNEVTYRSDYDHWNREDMWGYPFETLLEGGDCEDFAILKLESLKHLGWSEDQFAIAVGFSNFANPPASHAVLLATLDDGAQLLLDSLEDEVSPPKADHHFSPMYALTRQHIFMVAGASLANARSGRYQ